MNATTSRSLLVAGAMVALSIQSDVQAQPIASWDLRGWINSTPARPLQKCPRREPVAGVSSAPFFSFNENNYPPYCSIDGPYKWDGSDWYVQRMRGVGFPPQDVVRVCSPQAKYRLDPNTFFRSPCGGQVGTKGCKICTKNGVAVPETSRADD